MVAPPARPAPTPRACRGSGARMRLLDGAAQAFCAGVGVDLRGGERGVPEEVLDAAEVRTALDEVGGRAVPQGVRGDVAGDPGAGRVAVHEGAHGAVPGIG